MLTTVTGLLGHPHGDLVPVPVESGTVVLQRARHGVYEEWAVGPDRVETTVTGGVMAPVRVAPGVWRAHVYPADGASAWSMPLQIAPDTETVDLTDAPVLVDGVEYVRGPRGEVGPVGPRGERGERGEKGERGDPGEVGPEGPRGPRGETGERGEKGDRGEKGETGERGEKGDRGEKGETGDRGLTGPKGDAGPASLVPGPPGPPGAVATPSDYLVVGPGRPDVPSGTGLTAQQLAALPTGCEYRSTDGAGVGAWVWQKRGTTWTVTQGDTGWRAVEATFVTKGFVLLRRTSAGGFITLGGGDYGSATLSGLSIGAVTGGFLNPIPAGWRAATMTIAPVFDDGGQQAAFLVATSAGDRGVMQIRGATTATVALARSGSNLYLPSDPWPFTIPGTSIN